jgi:hypothetical protein
MIFTLQSQRVVVSFRPQDYCRRQRHTGSLEDNSSFTLVQLLGLLVLRSADVYPSVLVTRAEVARPRSGWRKQHEGGVGGGMRGDHH